MLSITAISCCERESSKACLAFGRVVSPASSKESPACSTSTLKRSTRASGTKCAFVCLIIGSTSSTDPEELQPATVESASNKLINAAFMNFINYIVGYSLFVVNITNHKYTNNESANPHSTSHHRRPYIVFSPLNCRSTASLYFSLLFIFL